jgi:hypothetical protein
MIKVFKKESDWGGKVNFVDQNNNLVGYDTADDCCAHGFYFIAPDIVTTGSDEYDGKPDPDLSDYEFDTKFFHDQREDFNYHGSENSPDNAVVFRMISLRKPDLYLHLYNSHNGYYSKGFEASFGEIKEGSV